MGNYFPKAILLIQYFYAGTGKLFPTDSDIQETNFIYELQLEISNLLYDKHKYE